MATARPKSGVTEYTATTGSGPLTLTGPAPGFRGFVSADDGLSYPYAIYQEGIAFETGIGTYTHAARSLTRTTILANINGTAVPLVLGAGTKEVSVVIPGERVAMLDVENEWVSDQSINGNRLRMDADKDSYIAMSTDDVLDVVLGNAGTLNVAGGIGILTLLGSDSTAIEGPSFEMRRDSATPAANDVLGVQYVRGRDASGTLQPASKIRTYWTSVTAGAHTAIMEFAVASAGALQTILQLRPSTVSLPSTIDLFTSGKVSSNIGVVGSEMLSNGTLIGSTNNITPMFACRSGSDGPLLTFVKNGTGINSIGIVAGDIQYLGFSAVHLSEWAPGQGGPEFEILGTVVATAEGTMDSSGTTPLVMVRPAVGPDDRRVFGVVGSRQNAELSPERDSYLGIKAIGDAMIRVRGEVAGGDLLCASLTPGVAEAVLADTPLTAAGMSCIVAKATQDSPDDGGERLVPCVLMAG